MPSNMPGWISSSAVRLAVALVAALGLLLAPTGGSASHDNAAHAAHHQAGLLADTLAHGHDHDHDDMLEEDGGGSAHSHHNPADHGHVTVGTVGEIVVDHPPVGRQWRSAASASERPFGARQLEKPPRPIAVHA
ncbi:hypothetical protein [Plastoroseomonas hellenica]|uniref:hypothetical protein n=1 Tax=Plastoroseomonas hellenica TaxID=2687306 RepID=UPI001BA908F6|nr:hypothetical protein [Plastoroseomonas hellenica]MBR0644941.1 hypothetical protein [Plastoroseomonas hellenica]